MTETESLPPHDGPDPDHARRLTRAQAIALIAVFRALAERLRAGKGRP
jgi:hypothetical protein